MRLALVLAAVAALVLLTRRRPVDTDDDRDWLEEHPYVPMAADEHRAHRSGGYWHGSCPQCQAGLRAHEEWLSTMPTYAGRLT